MNAKSAIVECGAVQEYVSLADLEKLLQHEYFAAKSASIQPRMSPDKFAV